MLGTTKRNENAKTLKKAEDSWRLRGESDSCSTRRSLGTALVPALLHAATPMSCPGSRVRHSDPPIQTDYKLLSDPLIRTGG